MPSHTALHPLTILVIEDNLANAQLIEAVAARHWPEARIVNAMQAGLGLDLALLDLMMPSINGYALLDSLGRLTAEGDLVPIMVLTADTSMEAKRRALALGARDIVTKPFDVFEFALRVANLIALRLMFERLQANMRQS